MTRRERDPKLKKAAMAKYGHDCMVCNLNFDSVYRRYSRAKNGENYIEVHHTKPVSAMKERQKTRIEDVIVICSNCHRIIHRRIPMLDWKKLRSDLRKWNNSA